MYDKYFKKEQNDSLTFIGIKMIVTIPESHFERKISSINGKIIETIGILEGYIFDDENEEDTSKAIDKFVMDAPSSFILVPTNILVRKRTVDDPITDELVSEKIYDLIFLNGDTFIRDTKAIKSIANTKKYTDMVLQGYLPGLIEYEQGLLTWDKCNRNNGDGDLKVNMTVLSMIYANLVRDPNDLYVQFRHTHEKNKTKGILNGKFIRYMELPRYIDSYSAITSADPRRAITVSIEKRKRTGKEEDISVIEKAIQ